MRWIPFVILVYLVLLVQTSIGGVLRFSWSWVGQVGPDFAAIVAVYCALGVRGGWDAMLAGALLGLGVDLSAAGGAGAAAAIGPMPIAYALAAGAVWRMREAFFGERPLPQAVLTLLLTAAAHTVWVTLQTLRAGGLPWSAYGAMLLQALAVAVYSALLAPPVCFLLARARRWFLTAPAGRGRRR